jgi:hypothetical protein
VELCENPKFTAADSNFNGSTVIIIKNDRYYILEGLEEIF